MLADAALRWHLSPALEKRTHFLASRVLPGMSILPPLFTFVLF